MSRTASQSTDYESFRSSSSSDSYVPQSNGTGIGYIVDWSWFQHVDSVLGFQYFYQVAKTQFQTLDKEGDGRVSQLVDAMILSPAKYIYTTALDHYLSFDLAERKVTVQEYLRGMKTRLGKMWNQKLETPLRAFLARAQATAKDQLQRIRNALNSDKGDLTLGDVIGAGRNLVSPVIGAATGLVSGIWQKVWQASQRTLDFVVPVGVRPKYEQLQARLLDALQNVRSSLDDAKASVASRVERSKLNELNKRLRAKVEPFAQHLQAKLQEAIKRARDLSVLGSDYLLHQKIAKLPSDTARFVLEVPALFFKRYKGIDAGGEFGPVVAKIHGLLSSIKDVLLCLLLLDSKRQPELKEADQSDQSKSQETKETKEDISESKPQETQTKPQETQSKPQETQETQSKPQETKETKETITPQSEQTKPDSSTSVEKPAEDEESDEENDDIYSEENGDCEINENEAEEEAIEE